MSMEGGPFGICVRPILFSNSKKHIRTVRALLLPLFDADARDVFLLGLAQQVYAVVVRPVCWGDGVAVFVVVERVVGDCFEVHIVHYSLGEEGWCCEGCGG
jgi:hypothetical protein